MTLMKSNLLKDTFPDVYAELKIPDPTLTKGSERVVEWICHCGYEWSAPVYRRGRSGAGRCPACLGWTVIDGVNDLATTHPELASELIDILVAKDITAKSTIPVGWICSLGHGWAGSPHQRLKSGKQCPYCYGRKILVGFNDLKSTHPQLAGELIDRSLETALTEKSVACVDWRCELGHTWSAVVHRRAKQNTGCPYCSGNKIKIGFNDLATTHPFAASLLKDQSLANKLSAGSSRFVDWQCPVGHKWMSKVSWVVKYTKCRYCSGSIVTPETSLKAKNPTLVKQWHPDKNDISPEEASPHSGQRVWWMCEKGHEWDAVIYSRTRGHGCPRCVMHGTSLPEIELADRIEAAGYTIERNTRQIIPPMELDIFIPDLRVGIEFNSTYWHRDESRDIRKANACVAAGVRLIVVWYDDYTKDPDAEYERAIKEIDRSVDEED